jgi:hypothetical protein
MPGHTLMTPAKCITRLFLARPPIELSRQIGVLSKPEYERLAQVAEGARQHSLSAQADLKSHSTSMAAMATAKQ